MPADLKVALEKFVTLILSRRFWVTVITVAVSVIAVYNGIAAAFGFDGITPPDPDSVAGQIAPFAEALAAIITGLIVLFGGRSLSKDMTARPATRTDHLL